MVAEEANQSAVSTRRRRNGEGMQWHREVHFCCHCLGESAGGQDQHLDGACCGILACRLKWEGEHIRQSASSTRQRIDLRGD